MYNKPNIRLGVVSMFKRHTLSWELAMMLVVKLAFIYGLWLLCFSHPTDKQLAPVNVAAHLILSSSAENKHNDKS